MDRDAIVEAVAERADLADRTAAERATVETLRTLGEHVPEGRADELAAALPADLGEAVTSHSDDHPDPERFDAEEFAARVAEREGDDVHADAAMTHARAVLSTVADRGGADELAKAREHLSGDLDALFEPVDSDAV